ncbi:hypothetical protein F2368_06965 [Salmonella enterica]|nr:hypothetical protein [Salmonella enterica]EEH7137751.1 hypothetical protein [Salmonella enterica]EHU8212930.1 hypothetical protein [Salmonella enterica]
MFIKLKIYAIRHTPYAIPSSKPETQLANIAATLSTGRSITYNNLRCLETETMKNAYSKLGAKIIEEQG